MNFLEERILKDGIIKEGNVLKVDSFLNHQMDIDRSMRSDANSRSDFEGKEINENPDNRSIRNRDRMYCGAAFSCAGRICKKISEHQSGRGDACGRGRIVHT